MAKRFPVIGNLMQKINYRKNRDQLILAGVISCCTIFTVWYTIR